MAFVISILAAHSRRTFNKASTILNTFPCKGILLKINFLLITLVLVKIVMKLYKR